MQHLDPSELLVVVVVFASMAAPIAKGIHSWKNRSRIERGSLPPDLMDALPPLLVGGRLAGSRRVDGGWAGRETRMFLRDPRANGTVDVEVSMRVGGRAFFRAVSGEPAPSTSPKPSGAPSQPTSWSLRQGEDDPPPDAASSQLWERLRQTEAFTTLLGVAPEGGALDVRHEVFVGRMLRWESGNPVPFDRVLPLITSLLPALEGLAVRLEREESGRG